MATLTKNRNILTFTKDDGKYYTLDLNTMELIGIMGKPLQTLSCKDILRRILYTTIEYPNLSNILRHAISRCTTPRQLVRYHNLLSTAEKIDALDLPDLNIGLYDYETIDKHWQAFCSYINEDRTRANNFNTRDFLIMVRFREKAKTLGALANVITPEIYYSYTNDCNNDEIPLSEWDIVAYYGVRCKVYDFCGNLRKVRDYIRYCQEIGKTPVKTNNFTREYVETKKEYERRKEEIDNSKLIANYAKQAKAWEFSYGGYTIVVPTCGKDIIDEGSNMHHCVGGYVGRVVDGDTYIVFVRHENAPKECYITAQVGVNGDIGQYFLAYDKYISKAEDIAFRDAFAKHLAKVWQK